MVSFLDAFVDVGEVGAKTGDGFEDGLAVGAVEGFDGFGVEVFDGGFVGAGDAVVGVGVAVEGVDGFGDAHLGGGHCLKRRTRV